MASLQNIVKIGDEEIPIDPMTLFSRLLVFILVIREDEIASYLFYELSPYPTSLFKNGILRDPKKIKVTRKFNQECKSN